jgi:hypothetical protein
MKQISYLKSFKVQDEDEDDLDNYEDLDETKINKGKNYYHYIKYAIRNASAHSNHVDINPCYGFDLTPSSGHLLDAKSGFIETSLPAIKPPSKDFHINLLNTF